MTSPVLSPIQVQVALPWVSGHTSVAEIRGTHHELLTYEATTDIVEVPDLLVSGDISNLAEDDPCDPTTTSKPKAPMQSLNQLPVVTDIADARSA
jgi:hypothetical protein